MKNKILILIGLLLCFTINVYALDDENIDVTVGEVDVPVYNVEVSWDSMEFTYNEQVNFIWDNNSHTYELHESTYKWLASNNNINVKNKSSNPIKIQLNYKKINENIIGNFNMSDATIYSGVSMDFKLTLDGELSPSNTDYIKVGTIELNIS